jgi:ElaB/YqjD/DUF883 family membrane-anchored ribosome-binding protein
MDRISTDKLMRDLHSVVVDAEDLLKATASQSGERVEQIRARAAGSLRAAREQLEAAGHSMEEQVREHPWTAVGIGAGVGLLIGLLLGRRS